MSRLGAAITWLGHSSFHLAPEPEGAEFLIDPWLDNPKAPANAAELARRAKVILVTHGHFDHLASVTQVARQSGATVLTSYELGNHLVAEGLPDGQVIAFNRGGAARCAGLTVTLVQAFHSSSGSTDDGRPRYLGEPCGLVIELPDGTVIYNTGDTCVFGDMALIAELYRPTVLMLPIGDFYTMGPKQAAKACELVQPQWIIPQHYGTFPALPGTPDALRALLPTGLRDRLIAPEPGETIR